MIRQRIFHRRAWLLGGLTLLLGMTAAPAQTPVFQPLVTGHRVTCAEYADGRVYAGLEKGGLVEFSAQTGEALRILTRRDGLGGHFVRDLAYVAGTLWVATQDGGLTAIHDPGRPDETRRIYSSLLSSLAVTAVAGRVIGATERIYYGTAENGLGVINSGLPGAYLTTQEGLISDTIVDLALTPDNLLLVATPVGLSRFADNTFINYPYDNPANEAVRDLEVDAEGRIWAATARGVKRWNDETRTLEEVFGTASFLDLAVDGSRMWALHESFGVPDEILRVYSIDPGDDVRLRTLPAPIAGQQNLVQAVAAGDGGAWVMGRLRPVGWVPQGSLVSRPFLVPVGDAAAAFEIVDTCLMGIGGGFDGVAIDSRRRAWVGDREGDGLAGFDGSAWYNVTQLATVENDSSGLFNWGGGLLTMARAGDAIWFNQFVTGAIRFTPATAPGGVESWDLVHRGNSGLQSRFIVNIAVHPDGPVFFCSDAGDSDVGVDVLIDPDNWRDPAAWIHLDPSLLGGNEIWAVGFERRDVVWFGVRNAGLQRWDINGPAAGPDDPLTWDDFSDDQWLAQPLLQIPGSDLGLDAANAILAGPDGSLWVGGAGLVNFRYEAVLQLPILLGQWQAITQAGMTGLLHQRVRGAGFDRNGDLWALTDAGLNRLRLGVQPVAIDAFTDLGTFLTLDPSFYSPAVITPLPGGSYRRLDMAADGTRLVLSSDLGAVMADIPAAGATGSGDLDTVFLYPNPFPGQGGTGLLNIGGLELASDQTIAVEVLNMAGQVVHSATGRRDVTGVWDGRSMQGRLAASGLYVVKITLADRVVVKTLAVSR
jgi:hypothetical protein